ncbi:hypothetical protein Tco_0073096 [Tanacetum coccineum]
MVVQAQEEIGEGSAMPTDPHHTPIITQPSSSQPQRTQKSRRSKEVDIKIPQSRCSIDPKKIADEAVNEEPNQEITSLKKRVKKLEKKGGSRTHKLKRLYMVGRSRRVVPLKEESLGDQEDASKQWRIDVLKFTLAQALAALKSEKVQEKGMLLKSQVYQLVLLQQRARTRASSYTNNFFTTTNIAKVEADYQLAQRLQAQEQEELSDAEKATLFVQLLEKRRKHFAAKRIEEKKNIPPTKA